MSESEPQKIMLEVAYAKPDKQVIVSVEVEQGCTIEGAIQQSGIIDQFPDIALDKSKVGIFGKLSKLTAEVKSGDRVEIYRPLIADPKEVRRKREAEGKKMKKGGGEVK